MPLQATSGAASYDAFGGGVAVLPKFIEDYFSTYLYSGTSANQTITNGIDLSTKGGLVWIKTRNQTYNHYLTDSASGIGSYLSSNATNAQNIYGAQTDDLTSFNTNGFSLGADGNLGWVNASGSNMVSWSWAKAPKFFDVVTWVGTGGVRTLTHNLGSVPGSIFVKKMVGAPQSWAVYHRSLGATEGLALDLPNVAQTWSGYWNNTEPTSTQFTVGGGFNAVDVDYPGTAYVAYLFAHNAGGFGLTGTDNVISCGSYSPSAGAPSTFVDLGFEPQFVIIKNTNISGSAYTGWGMFDNMRGVTTPGDDQFVLANSNAAESNGAALGIASYVDFNATGFTANATTLTGANGGGHTYIYIAIRRGPMKVPTSGASVFNPVLRTGTSAAANVSTGNTPDWVIIKQQLGSSGNAYSRLQGPNRQLYTESTLFEVDQGAGYGVTSFLNTSFNLGLDANGENQSGRSLINWTFSRAPSFFDEVCYTGTGSARTVTHNLTVAPELMIVKSRSNAFNWSVYNASIGATNYLYLNLTNASSAFSGFWNDTSPTASVFSVGGIDAVNGSGYTYVAYLFATCAGVSKVGSYTGNGSTQTIDCGFGASGARFVLIKRTDSASGWYVYDTARGMTTLTDPYLFLNSTAADAATLGSVTTVSTGFALNSAILAAINVSGGSYIFFAVA